MYDGREDYIRPVGFAREPSEERRRWIGRMLTLVIVLFVLWLLWNRVVNPPQDTPQIPIGSVALSLVVGSGG